LYFRDEAVVFQTQIQETPTAQNQENLREAMVSNIDDVSFEEAGKKGGGNSGDGMRGGSAIAVSSCGKSPSSSGGGVVADSSAGGVAEAVVENGVQTVGDSNVDKKTETVQKKRVPLIRVPPEGTNGHDNDKGEKKTKEEEDEAMDVAVVDGNEIVTSGKELSVGTTIGAITNGCSDDSTQEKNNNGPDDKAISEEKGPSSLSSSQINTGVTNSNATNGTHHIPSTGVRLIRTDGNDGSSNMIPVNRKRRPTEEMKPPQSAFKKRIFSHHGPSSASTLKGNNSKVDGRGSGSKNGGSVEEPKHSLSVGTKGIGTPTKHSVSGGSQWKPNSVVRSRLPPMKIDSVLCLQVC
jgi:hypothetical protein